MRQTFKNAQIKLQYYYLQTQSNIGYIYSTIIIFAPDYKLGVFEILDWESPTLKNTLNGDNYI